MIRLFLCIARWQIRSIVSLCEEFGSRSKVQKELLLTYIVTIWLHLDDILEEVKLTYGDRNQNSGSFCV